MSAEVGVRRMWLGVLFFSLACATVLNLWLGLAASALLVVAVVVLLWRRRPAHAVAFGTFAGLTVVVTLGLAAVERIGQETATVVFEDDQ